MNPPLHDEKQGSADADATEQLVASSLQKLYLLTPARAVLQLRVPGENVLVIVDAHEGRAAFAASRPALAEPALAAQATLRGQLEGARVHKIARERFADAPGAKKPMLRIALETPQGPRALVAEPRTQLLFVLAPDAKEPGRERVVWAAPGAPAERRSGSQWPLVTRAEEGAVSREQGALASPGPAQAALQRDQLVRVLAGRKKKLERAREAVLADRARALASGDARKNAELLLPLQKKVPRGAKEVRVPDWSQLDDAGAPREIVLTLDPALSAAANATRWLKRAQRYLAAIPRIDARVAELDASLAQCELLLTRVRSSEGEAALRAASDDVQRSARPAERAQKTGGPRPRDPPRRQPHRAFRGRSGARILVGKSAKDNDELLRQAKGNDLWLHARGVQGSHVFVPDPGEAPDSDTLGDAALLAAHFSSARGNDGTEVSWTRRKFVRKGKGAAPGAVTITQEKTLRVRLDEQRLASLLASENS